MLCVLTTAGSLVSAGMIHQEQLKTLQRAKQAEDGLKLARQSADEMFQISEEELADKPFMDGARKRMLTSALGYYRGLIAQSADDPDARQALAVSQARVEKILADLAVLQGGGRVDLLYRKDVKDDLRLSADQEKQLDDLHQSLERQRQEGFAAFVRLAPEERQEQSLKEARAKEAALDKILTAEQQRRLGQIALQLQGLSAFHDAEVANALKLTADQKQSLRAVEAEMFFSGPPGPREGPREKRAGFRSPLEKFTTVLNADQARRWKEMTGKPFTGESRPFGRPAFDHPPGPEPHDHDGIGHGHEGPRPDHDGPPPPPPDGPHGDAGDGGNGPRPV